MLPIIWFILVFSLGVSHRVGASTDSFGVYESPFLQILPQPSLHRPHDFWDFIKWDPNGRAESAIFDGECSPDLLNLSSDGMAPAQMKNYFNRCERTLKTGRTGYLANIGYTVFQKLHPERHPFARHVLIHLPGGINVKGLLALKSDTKPRPLVILRTGIFSNSKEFFPERYLFLQLFEQSPFHLLLLESTSGSEYMEHNVSFAFGGVEEGLQNYWIAQKLQSDEEAIHRIIDSVHLVGVSFGGQGVFFAALLNKLNQNSDPKKSQQVQSFLNFCPLVNLNETLAYHQEQWWSGKLMDLWASQKLSALRALYPDINREKFIFHVIERVQGEQRSLPLEWQNLNLPSHFLQEDFQSRLQNFWSEWTDIKTPFLIFSSEKDPLVPYPLNSKQIQNEQILIGKSNTSVILLPDGYHCSIPGAYQWRPMASLLQKYIISNSPKWKQQVTTWRVPVDLYDKQNLIWKVGADGPILQVFQPGHSHQEIKFPLDLLSLYKFKLPLSPDEQSLLLRWLNHNVKWSEESGLEAHWIE